MENPPSLPGEGVKQPTWFYTTNILALDHTGSAVADQHDSAAGFQQTMQRDEPRNEHCFQKYAPSKSHSASSTQAFEDAAPPLLPHPVLPPRSIPPPPPAHPPP